jgi:PAS domain S-box-containing protein
MAMAIDESQLLDALPVMVWTMLPDGRIDFVNRIWSEYTGLTLDAAQELDWAATIKPDGRLNLLPHGTPRAGSGNVEAVKTHLRDANGRYQWFDTRLSPVVDATSMVVKWVCAAVDINEHPPATDAPCESEHDARLILDSIPAGVEVLDPSGKIITLNRQAIRYFGKSEQELRCRGLAEFIHPGDLNTVLGKAAHALSTGDPYHAEQRFLGADGSYRWFQVRGIPLRDESGRIIRWYALHIDIDERKRKEEAVGESEEYARLIVDSIPGMIAVFAPDGELELASDQILEFYGKTFEELKSWTTTDSTHPDDLPRAIELFTHALTSGDPFDFEVRTRRSDGVYHWFQTRGLPLRDANGTIVRWYNLLIDIDERKRAEEALTASEHNLQLIIDTIPAMAWSANTEGVADFFNQFYLDYLGRSLEETRGWGWTEAVHADDIGKLADVWKTTLAKGTLGECEARMRRFDGAYRWFLHRVNPLRDDQGRIVRWYGTNIDIDDRKRAEDDLRRSEAFLAEGQRLARMGSLSWDVETGAIVWSDALYKIFEIEPGTTLTAERVFGQVHPEDLPMIEDVLERKESTLDYQHRIVMPDQSIKHLHVVAHRTRNEFGRVEYIGTVLDITRRRSGEEALEKLRSELAQVTRIMSLGVLTASFAHEVNQPLAGIVTNASTCLRMLAADPPNIELAKETARRSIRDGNRAADVISRLRALFSKRQITIGPVDLNDAVRETISMSRGDIIRSRATVRTELAEGLPLVAGDRIQLQQVIMNLLRNAADAVNDVKHDTRRILIRTEASVDGEVRLSVEDDGIGFSAVDADRVFEAFYTTKTGGMGIGLSVSRSIIESHNGRLWARTNDCRGVTFCFSVPQHSTGDEAAKKQRPAPTRSESDAYQSVRIQ